jgi:hypothetical protein
MTPEDEDKYAGVHPWPMPGRWFAYVLIVIVLATLGTCLLVQVEHAVSSTQDYYDPPKETR